MYDLIYTIARAKYIRREFDHLSLSSTVWSYTEHDMVWTEMENWKALNEEEREVWFSIAVEWLENLKRGRPNIFYIISKKFKNIEEGEDIMTTKSEVLINLTMRTLFYDKIRCDPAELESLWGALTQQQKDTYRDEAILFLDSIGDSSPKTFKFLSDNVGV